MSTLALALLAAAPVSFPSVPATGAAELNAYYETDPNGLKLTAQLLEGEGPYYALFAAAVDSEPILAWVGPVGQDPEFVVPASVLEDLTTPIELFAAYLDHSGVVVTKSADLVLGGAPFCDRLDFNYTIGPDDGMVAGQAIGDQWADISLQISARNGTAGHPDLAILFDTSSPTGGDDDLATPNLAAVGNTEALGHVLIIAEDGEDSSPADGLVDDPDDERGGGSLYFDFEEKATVCSVVLVDIDEQAGTELRFYRGGDLTTPDETLTIFSLGDGSVQRVDFFEPDLDRFEVFFKGSGAVGPIDLIPCPRVINFDETSTGIPREDLDPGQWITDQFQDIGVTIAAFNDNPAHPDKAILFDSENPTGGDTDLLTPNPAVVGNDTPLGKVLIIAEDDVDTSPADGLVDDPDDEAAGGDIEFTFDQDVRFVSARVLDVDAMELDFWRLYDAADNEIATILIPDLPDGNVQLVEPNVSGVRRAVLDLGGSGAVTRVRFCPETDQE